jgi:hypothetical protein
MAKAGTGGLRRLRRRVVGVVAEMAGPIVDKRTRSALFVALGAGEGHTVIVGVLDAVAARGHLLSADLLARTAAWLDGYVGADDEPSLRSPFGRVSPSTRPQP